MRSLKKNTIMGCYEYFKVVHLYSELFQEMSNAFTELIYQTGIFLIRMCLV